MPIGAITMILTNVGLQIYNNWCGSRQNDKLLAFLLEFEKAARERNTEHMWKLLREGQELTMQFGSIFKTCVNEQAADAFGIRKRLRQSYPKTFLEYEQEIGDLYKTAQGRLEIECLVE